MPKSFQTPLTSPLGRSPGDFSLRQEDRDAAVFDDAAYFTVVTFRPERRRREFRDFVEAVAEARECGGLIYAVAASGSSVNLDREKWDEWLARWEENGRV